MYSIPANKDTWSTERIIGTWLKNQAKEIVLIKLRDNPNFGYMREKLDFAS
jgi:hypothetical protein